MNRSLNLQPRTAANNAEGFSMLTCSEEHLYQLFFLHSCLNYKALSLNVCCGHIEECKSIKLFVVRCCQLMCLALTRCLYRIVYRHRPIPSPHILQGMIMNRGLQLFHHHHHHHRRRRRHYRGDAEDATASPS